MRSFIYIKLSLLYLDLCLKGSSEAGPCSPLCEWVQWAGWSNCDETCGGGQRCRKRGICCDINLSTPECLNDCEKDSSGLTEYDAYNTICLNEGTFVATTFNSGYCQCRDMYEGGCCEQIKPTKEEPNGLNSCQDVCSWSSWELSSECSVSCGGGGLQQRERRLCCLQEYGGFERCATKCHIEDAKYVQQHVCGEKCLNGGTPNHDGVGCQCLNRTFGHCCEELLPGCTPFPTDVIFVLDSSVSQTEKQFRAQLEFVTKFVEKVNISTEEFQIAVITYSTEAKIEITFKQSINKHVLQSLIQNIRFRPGATFTNKGLKSAMEVARKSERRKGMVTLTYAFVLTDGMSNNRKATKIAARELRNAEVHVVVIGIGKQVSHQELVDIASPGDEFSPSYVFSVGDFNALDTLLKQLVQVTCDDCKAVSHLSDIVFLLDETNEMSEVEFQISLDVMTSIVQRTGHINEQNGQRVGLVRLGNTLKRELEFSRNLPQSNLILAIQTLFRQPAGLCEKHEQCTVKNITSAVNKTIDHFFNLNGRSNARKFLIILSNGKFENAEIVREEMINIHELSDFKVFMIGPGSDVNMNGLLSLAKEANHVYIVLDNDDVSKLDIIQSEFSYNVCK